MGRGGAILTVGRPLDWNEAKPKLAYVREHGVSQFIAHYARHKEIKRDALFYGSRAAPNVIGARALSRRTSGRGRGQAERGYSGAMRAGRGSQGEGGARQ